VVGEAVVLAPKQYAEGPDAPNDGEIVEGLIGVHVAALANDPPNRELALLDIYPRRRRKFAGPASNLRLSGNKILLKDRALRIL
jgi:hypothetical protein